MTCVIRSACTPGRLASLRGATAPSRNGFSIANRERPATMAEQLFWAVLGHLGAQSQGFVAGHRRGAAFRFKVPIHVVDTTVMELVANCMDWAKHRRRQDAAKTHNQTNVPAGLTNVTAIAAGGYHCLALTADGTVKAWGDNTYGQSSVPVGLSNVTAISGGYYHSLALKSDETVVVWGSNSSGQTNVPVNLTKVFSISAGGYHSLVITNR